MESFFGRTELLIPDSGSARRDALNEHGPRPFGVLQKIKDVTLPIPFDNKTGNIIDTIVPDREEIPVSMNTINPASDRFASANADMFGPVGMDRSIDPNLRAKGQFLFNSPGEKIFANQGGIMSTNKAFQRVA